MGEGQKGQVSAGICSNNYLPIMVLLAILVDFIKKMSKMFSDCF